MSIEWLFHTVCMTAFDGLTVMSKWWVEMGLVSTQNWLVGKYFISEKLPHAFVYKKFNTKTLCMKKGLLGEVYRMTDERLKCPFRLKSQDRCLVVATGRRSFGWL